MKQKLLNSIRLRLLMLLAVLVSGINAAWGEDEVFYTLTPATGTNNGYAFPFGIYDDDTLVGFVMIGYDKDDYWDDAPAIANNNYNLWRLMIDKRYQQKGYGRKAIELALEFIRTSPCGKAEYCWLSYEPENKVAKALYESFGFVETGDVDGEELIAVLKL